MTDHPSFPDNILEVNQDPIPIDAHVSDQIPCLLSIELNWTD
jgi:hypothetical protein